MTNPETLATLGENEALKRTVSRLKKSANTIVGSGDDAAVVKTSNDRFVVTTDTMIEGNDFKTEWSSAFDLGWKAVATNISDVAAMGAKPIALVVALAVPKETEITWLEQFADGLQAAIDYCKVLVQGNTHYQLIGQALVASDQTSSCQVASSSSF